MVIAQLMASGQFDSQLRRVRKHNLERRDCLIDALRRHFGDVRLIGTDAGAQLSWILPQDFPDARSLCDIARAHRILLKRLGDGPGARTLRGQFDDCALILGYGHLSPAEIQCGTQRLDEALSL
jgi:GntR family transcriptional regulator/MocR family aminotransferase